MVGLMAAYKVTLVQFRALRMIKQPSRMVKELSHPTKQVGERLIGVVKGRMQCDMEYKTITVLVLLKLGAGHKFNILFMVKADTTLLPVHDRR